MKLRLIYALAVSLGISGCQLAQEPKYDFKQTSFHLEILPNSTDFATPDPKGLVDGEAHINFNNKTCKIILRKYPQCLLHEVRHCIEGNWHEGKESHDDC